LMAVPLLVGGIMKRFENEPVKAAGSAEILFIVISGVAIATALALSGRSKRHPELGLDDKCKK